MSLAKKGFLGLLTGSVLLTGLTTGCASGGYKLTRTYAGFVNKQPLILRIVIYLLTGVVFAVTMLIDVLLFNTQDFWEGRVSAGSYRFEKEGQIYVAHHQHLPGGLRESRLEVFSREKTRLQEILLRETTNAQIEMYVDGVLKARVQDIFSVPQVAVFDAKGQVGPWKKMFHDLQVAQR